MDIWPADTRVHEKGKGKSKGFQENWDHPRIVGGSLGAFNLVRRKNRFVWTFAAQPHNARRVLSKWDTDVQIFPVTRRPSLSTPKISVTQKAERGANFLRTYFPDIDVPAELIREELEADAKLTGELNFFDPSVGNTLEIIRCHGIRRQTSLVLFPMGECLQNLNISFLEKDKNRNIVFNPSVGSSFKFETPIQQIVPPIIPQKDQKNTVLIRTYRSTALMSISAERNGTEPVQAIATREVDILPSDVGGEPVVDISMHNSNSNVILATDRGHIYQYHLSASRTELVHSSAQDDSSVSIDNFWRLAHIEANACIFTSKNVVRRLDFRTSNSHSNVFSVASSNHLITSVEPPGPDSLFRITTTADIIWVDERFPGRPLLSYKHERQFDRTLQTNTVILDMSPLSFLTSRKNGLVTVYDVSRSLDGLVCANSPCFSPSRSKTTYIRSMGHAITTHPSASQIMMLRLSDQGAIYRQDVRFFGDCCPTEPLCWNHSPSVWLPEVQDLEPRVVQSPSDIGLLGRREFSVVDLRPAYQHIFSLITDDIQHQGEEFYEMMERLPDIWQQSDVPIEHMLTTFDIAFRSGDAPLQASRADFLTEGMINSLRGYRAVIQGRLPFTLLKQRASWHGNIRRTLKKLLSDPIDDWQSLYEDLSKFNLNSTDGQSVSSMRREKEAREQLVLDLALSTDIFSAQAFANPNSSNLDEFETMSIAAQAMSLDDEPPPVKFHYLRVARNDKASHYADQGVQGRNSSEEDVSPLGVRFLLREWDVGTDPQDYTFHDPYDAAYQDHVPQRQRRKSAPLSTPTTTQNTIPSQPLRPPAVVATKPSAFDQGQIENATLTHFRNQSQDVGFRHAHHSQVSTTGTGMAPSSQDLMTSTQVLPGPYGGRESLAKKKPARKRLGGF